MVDSRTGRGYGCGCHPVSGSNDEGNNDNILMLVCRRNSRGVVVLVVAGEINDWGTGVGTGLGIMS